MIDRKSKIYNIKCLDCKKNRLVTYAQSWNVQMDKSTGRCKRCSKGRNLFGLKKGHGWNKGLKGFNIGHPPFFIAFGKDNPSWKGGITPISTKIRNSAEYGVWRTSVFKRDDYTCQYCRVKGGNLQAHHIKPFSLHPESRLDIENGMTLCVDCHKTTDSYLSNIQKNYGLRV